VPLCENPFINYEGVPCPCGKCDSCLVNRKRLWAHRIELESYCHDHSSFVTLTYDDEHLPFSWFDKQENKTVYPFLPTVNPKDPRNFLKRLRKAVSPDKLRYYLVGEYGDRSWRPHYHIALFGYPSCHHGQTRKDKHAKGLPCCPPCDLLLEKWGFGAIDNARVEQASAGYIANYCTKKLTKKGDELLNDRHPEFSRMSRKPGIGFGALDEIVKAIKSEYGEEMLTEHGDVPISLTQGGKQKPLGTYLRNKLRELAGLTEIITEYGEIIEPKTKAKEAFKKDLRTMQEAHALDPTSTPDEKASIKHYVERRDRQKIKNFKSRMNLTAKEKKL